MLVQQRDLVIHKGHALALLQRLEGLGAGLEGHHVHIRHGLADVGLLGAALDRDDLLAGQRGEVADAAVGLDQHLLAGHEGGQREVDDGFALLVVRQGRGQQVDMALLQLGDARGDGELLDLQLDAQPGGDGLGQVDLVADDLARLGVDEAVGLVGAEHADDELALLLDVVELVGVGGLQGQQGQAQGGQGVGQTAAVALHGDGSL
mmetsp:Transcript_41225/g.96455  ORF Transcript_41225/g.96455 Transcript_41225/m.96455 type:complete len:206 (-) Transcript_41225:2094-2711(-)